MALQMPFKKEQKVLKTTNASLAKLQICSYKIVFLNKKVYILGYFFEVLTRIEEKDRQTQLLCYVSLIRACNKVL